MRHCFGRLPRRESVDPVSFRDISVIHLLRYIGRSWQHMALGHAAAVTSHLMTETNMLPVTDVETTIIFRAIFVYSVKMMEHLFMLPDFGTTYMQLKNQTCTYSAHKVAVLNSTSVLLCTPECFQLESFLYP